MTMVVRGVTMPWEEGEGERERLLSIVNEVERERIQKFVFAKDAHASLMGRLLLRTLILSAVEEAAVEEEQDEDAGWGLGDVVLEREEGGKPVWVDGRDEWGFNVSHDSNLVIGVAAKQSRWVGIDVMASQVPRVDPEESEGVKARKMRAFVRDFAFVFSQSEMDAITAAAASGSASQTCVFFTLWTLKEAVLKALGGGLAYGMENVEIGGWCLDQEDPDPDQQHLVLGQLPGREEGVLDRIPLSVALKGDPIPGLDLDAVSWIFYLGHLAPNHPTNHPTNHSTTHTTNHTTDHATDHATDTIPLAPHIVALAIAAPSTTSHLLPSHIPISTQPSSSFTTHILSQIPNSPPPP